MASVTAGVYEIPEEHREFLSGIREMVQGRVAPRAAEIDRENEYPWDIRQLFAEHDVLALPFEEEFGGTGTGTLMLQMAVEEVAKVSASCSLILMVQELGSLP
ncbi:MAG: acyl-CoA dehydrogenase family protein, partial [Thermoleophilaceae bacterium]